MWSRLFVHRGNSDSSCFSRRAVISALCASNCFAILPLVLPLFFVSYLLYGFIRPRISRKMRQEIEEEDEEEEASGAT